MKSPQKDTTATRNSPSPQPFFKKNNSSGFFSSKPENPFLETTPFLNESSSIEKASEQETTALDAQAMQSRVIARSSSGSESHVQTKKRPVNPPLRNRRTEQEAQVDEKVEKEGNEGVSSVQKSIIDHPTPPPEDEDSSTNPNNVIQGNGITSIPSSKKKEGSVVQRWESEVPDSEVRFNVGGENSLGEIDSDVKDFTSGPLSDHKVRTGLISGSLTDQISNAHAEITSGEISISGSGSGLDRSKALQEPGVEATQTSPDNEVPDGEQLGEEQKVQGEELEKEQEDNAICQQWASEERSEARAVQNQRASLPQNSANDSEEGSEAESNASEVRRELHAIDTEFDGSIKRPEQPAMDESGNANPARINEFSSDTEAHTNDLNATAIRDINEDRGEFDVSSEREVEGLSFDMSSIEEPQLERPGEEVFVDALESVGLTHEQQQFSENVNVAQEKLIEGSSEVTQHREQFNQEYEEQRTSLEAESQGQVNQITESARQQESTAHQEVETRVAEAKTNWDAEREAALMQHQVSVDQKIAQAEADIETEQTNFDLETTQAIDNAIAEAEGETAIAEARAEEETQRAEKEAEEGGFWDWVGSALDAVIDAITTVISAIFDALNWIIDQIFKALQCVIEFIVEAFRFIIIGILEVLQWGLKLLGDGLEALFGEQARKWIDSINSFIDDTISVLNAIIDWVREALVGVLEFINQGLQALVTLIKWSYTLFVLLITGLWIRYLWLAIEHFDRLWTNIWASFDGLGDLMMERLGPSMREFWTHFWTPGNQLLLAIGLIVFIIGLFVGISEVVAIIMIIIAALYLLTVVVELGNRFMEYVRQIWEDDVDGARETLADTIWWFLFNLPLVLLAIFGIRGGIKAIRGGRAVDSGGGRGKGGERAVPDGEAGRGGEGCFIAGTPIRIHNGFRSIEDLEPNDLILGWDFGQNRQAHCFVLRTIRYEVDAVYDIKLQNTTLTTTSKHPFWVGGRGWVEARSLTTEDLLCSPGRGVQRIKSITIRRGGYTVYNIEVGNVKNYLVSEEGILVHNKPMRASTLQERASALEPRVNELLEQARELPDHAPNKSKMIRQLEELNPEAERLGNKAKEAKSAEEMEGSRTRIEEVEESLIRTEEIIEVNGKVAGLNQRIHELIEQVKEVPPDKLETKYTLLQELEALKSEVSGMKEVIAEDAAFASELYGDIRVIENRVAEITEQLTRTPKEVPTHPITGEPIPRPHLEPHKNMLPTEGEMPYVSPRPGQEVVNAQGRAGYLDAEGRVWQIDHTKLRAGRFFEWDVQTSDGGHINVGSDGTVTH